jgi:DNA-directed RNA polymerase subunit RPC12/RpoP
MTDTKYICAECGNGDLWFDAYVDENDEVLASYDNVVCADCDFAETTAVERKAAA